MSQMKQSALDMFSSTGTYTYMFDTHNHRRGGGTLTQGGINIVVEEGKCQTEQTLSCKILCLVPAQHWLSFIMTH